MFSRAAIAVTAGADFVVKGTVDFVLLCAKDRGEVVGHNEGLTTGIGRTVRCNFYAKFEGSNHGQITTEDSGNQEYNRNIK